MRYRLMATYLGVPYHAGLGPDGNEATLFSPGPPPDELGFTPAGGHWRKQVNVTDLDALWQSRVVGEYRGEPCLVLDDLGDRLHIAYQGRDSARARQLGYWEIDREVFEVVVARQDVTGLTEERVEYPLDAAMFPPSNRDPVAQPGRTGAPRPRGPRPGAGGPPPSAAERTSPLRAVPRPGPQPARSRAGASRRYAEPGGRRPGAASRSGAPSRPDMAAWRIRPIRGGSQAEPRRAPRTGWRPGTARPRPSPGRTPAGPAGRNPGRSAVIRGRIPGRAGQIRGPSPGRAGRGPAATRAATAAPPGGRRAGRRDRVPQSVFAELLSLAAIPHAAYAVDEEVPGAMCLVKADGGFEVFSRTDDARLDVRFFEDEEAAYFYLFGVLAAEAVRSGRLRPGPTNGHVNGSRGPGVPSAPATENVSKYLRRKKLPKSAPRAVIVN